MSISLFIQSIDGKTVNQEIPVASQQMYRSYWYRISSENNLPILQHGEEGHSYDEKHLADLIQEVKTFVALTQVPGAIPSEHMDYITTRSARILDELKQLEGHRVNFFLG